MRSVCSLRPRSHVAARRIRVLPDDCVANSGDGYLVSGQTIRVNPDVDGAAQSTDDAHFADSGRAFNLNLYNFVRKFRQLAHGAISRKRNRHDGRRIVVELSDYGRVNVSRQITNNRGDAVAHVLRRNVNVSAEAERGNDE